MIGSLLPGGLATPATLVFADRLERNLAGMAAFAAGTGVALRPHAKTHKCPQIARRQIALGARGLSVATLGEAEILTSRSAVGQAGPEVEDVFIAFPLWPARDMVTRLGELAGRVRVTVGVDSAEAAGHLAPLAGQVRVMVEVDCGLARSGVIVDGVTGRRVVSHAVLPGEAVLDQVEGGCSVPRARSTLVLAAAASATRSPARRATGPATVPSPLRRWLPLMAWPQAGRAPTSAEGIKLCAKRARNPYSPRSRPSFRLSPECPKSPTGAAPRIAAGAPCDGLARSALVSRP